MPNDQQEKARFKYPFFKIELIYFSVSIDRMGKDKFTIDEMKAKFQGDEWIEQEHWSPNSDLIKLLKSLPNTSSDGEILDRTDVICLGLLWCNSDNFNRSQILFELLNPTSKTSRIDKVCKKDFEILERVLTIIVELAVKTMVNAIE